MQPKEKQINSKKSSGGNRSYLPPHRDEIEISLFGPCYGESVLLHVGNNQWVIVDSCIDAASESPASLAYLNRINLDPALSVKLIIATHWHDDHIRGLSTILRECNSAEFVCSIAQTSKEFLTLVNAYTSRSMMKSTGVDEYYEILTILKERIFTKKINCNPPKFAVADRRLWQFDPVPEDDLQSCQIYALSPSDASVLLAQIGIANLIPEVGETKRRIPTLRPNHAAVVLLIKIGNDSIILGSDLEETKDINTGWTAIINSWTPSKGQASLFKIPHHGASSGDNGQIWSLLLAPKPISALTPFVSGKVVLPQESDVVRILNNSENAFITGLPRQNKPTIRPKMVEKQLKEIGVKVRPLYFSSGHVRARGRYVNGKIDWHIELFNGALHLKDIHN